MTDINLMDIYDTWRRKAIDEGFKLNNFREHYNRYVYAGEKDLMTCAVGAKLAYLSLIKERREDEQIQSMFKRTSWEF